MSLIRSDTRTPATPVASEANGPANATPTRPTTPVGQTSQTSSARKRSSSPPRLSGPRDSQDASTSEKAGRRPTLSAPVPSSPTRAGASARAGLAASTARRNSMSEGSKSRSDIGGGEDVRAIKSEPALSAAKPAPTPTEYQEHFYQLGSIIVDPTHGQDARALLSVVDRKEGLKIYMYEPTPGQLYAISHAPSELTLPDGKSTQHQELQKALLFSGVAKCQGRFATENETTRKENKKIARAFTDKKPHPAHGGLRLQKHEGRYVLDVSSAFSFHGLSNASMDQVARFYANVLKQADEHVTHVGVIPADASCSTRMCIEAAPHLQDLARRIENHLEE